MSRKYLGPLIVFIVILLISYIKLGGYYDYDYFLRKRSEIASRNNKDIHVAVVWNLLREQSFLDGVKLAVNEVNQQGVTLKKDNNVTTGKLILHFFDDETSEGAEDSWLSISSDTNIMAVLGHSSSSSAVSASISYEYNGVLFISSIATDAALTGHNFKYTVSINPSEHFFVQKLIEFVQKNKFNKLAVLYTRDDYGIDFYDEFMAHLPSSIEMVASRSFYMTEEDELTGDLSSKRDIIYRLMQQEFDALILVARDEYAAKMIKQLHSMEFNKPILGSEGLDDLEIWNISEHTASNVYVVSVFPEVDTNIQNDPENERIKAFVAVFKKTYGYEPGYYAFQGYESVKVLASAYQITGSTDPIRVAATLEFAYKNGYNNYLFDLNGLITNKKMYVKEMVNGKFKMINSE